VSRHPALRTRYDDRAQRAVSDVPPAGPGRDADIVHRPDALRWPEALAAAAAAATTPFDLQRGPLLRLRSYPATDGRRLLLVVIHHIATDGWSMELFYRELSLLYAGRSPGPAPPGYDEFAVWQRSADAPLAAAEAFADRLGTPPGRLELGRGRQRPPARSMAGATARRRLPAGTAASLRDLAAQSGVSGHVVLLAVFYLSLARRTRQRDMLVGTVASGRTRPRFHDTIGFFASTLPVRIAAGPDTTIGDLLQDIGEQVRWILLHQDAPLEEIALRTRHSHDRSHAPLVDAVLVLQNDAVAAPEFAGVAADPVQLDTGTAKFDLMLEVTPVARTGEFELTWEYATGILDADDVADLAGTFERIAAAVGGAGGTVRSVTALSEPERQRIAAAQGTRRYWPDTDISDLFEQLARAGPHRAAVLDGETSVDRAELRGLRDRVAGCLAGHGVAAGDVVAIALPRSARSVAALLGTWWLGAVPVLLDIHHPGPHRDRLLRACRPAVVLAEGGDWPANTVVARWPEARHPGAATGPPVRRSADDPAWLVATSGSTGAPKVTVGTHRSLRNRCAWAWQTFPYADSEVAALRTPLGFVDAISEVVVPLLAGAPLAIVPDRAAWDGRELARVLARHRVTRMLATPSMLRHLLGAVGDLRAAAGTLRWCVSSGELLDAALLAELRSALPDCRVINLYGSSEVAGDATYADVTELPPGAAVPIGRPIANTEVLVVDGDGELVPPGTAGELVVTGAPVGLGYLADGDVVSAGGFRPAPGGGSGYWTGDLGWLGQDGWYYFAGRRDRQVKIRGCRVELGQVETTLLGLSGVAQAASWTDRAADGGEYICAAAVPEPGAVLSGSVLRRQLRELLPGYMVPARIATTDAVPLNSNGKLDRAAAALVSGPDQEETESAEMSPAERQLWLLWRGLLPGEQVGLDDDFFALGGDSLAANSMLAAVIRDTGVQLDVGDFLAGPTIRALVVRLASGAGSPAAAGEQVR
jgi:amino acid adenylation domain-containing protein